jgi:hypothetical protein
MTMITCLSCGGSGYHIINNKQSTCPFCNGTKKIKMYLSSDVDARIKFFDKYVWGRAIILLRDYPKLEKEFLKKQYDYQLWLFNFCFVDMNTSFTDKIKVVEG